MNCDILIVAGLWNSNAQHWQSQWQANYPAWNKARHRDWNHPQRDEWVAELDAAIADCAGRPILVAHSLGCIAVAHWAAWAQSGSPLKIAGAFLVAPSDVEAPSYPVDANGFAPIPLNRLPFPSMLVASTNDEYAALARSRAFARAWGSRLVEVKDAGHLNGASGYGPWPEGEAMLEEFCRALQP